MKNVKLIPVLWIGFGCSWIFFWIFCRFIDIYASNIPQEIMDSGYYENGDWTISLILVTWAIPLYFLLYLVSTTVLFFLKKINLRQWLLFAGTQLFVGLILLFMALKMG
jgi:hypothetical protein